jgi:hypothetical protein
MQVSANNRRPSTYVWQMKRLNANQNSVNAVTKVLEEYNGDPLAKKLGNFGSRFALAVVKAGHLLEDDIIGNQAGITRLMNGGNVSGAAVLNPHFPVSLTNGTYGKLGMGPSADPYGKRTLQSIFEYGGHFIDTTLDSRDFSLVPSNHIISGGKGVDIESDYWWLVPPAPGSKEAEAGIVELKAGFGKKNKGQEAIQLRRAAVLINFWAQTLWGKDVKVKFKLYFVAWSAENIDQIDFNEDKTAATRRAQNISGNTNTSSSAIFPDNLPIILLTGKGICDLLDINYRRAITELRKYAPSAKNYIFTTFSLLSGIYRQQKEARNRGVPLGARPRIRASNNSLIPRVYSNLFRNKNVKAIPVPKNNAAQTGLVNLLQRRLSAVNPDLPKGGRNLALTNSTNAVSSFNLRRKGAKANANSAAANAAKANANAAAYKQLLANRAAARTQLFEKLGFDPRVRRYGSAQANINRAVANFNRSIKSKATKNATRGELLLALNKAIASYTNAVKSLTGNNSPISNLAIKTNIRSNANKYIANITSRINTIYTGNKNALRRLAQEKAAAAAAKKAATRPAATPKLTRTLSGSKRTAANVEAELKRIKGNLTSNQNAEALRLVRNVNNAGIIFGGV